MSIAAVPGPSHAVLEDHTGLLLRSRSPIQSLSDSFDAGSDTEPTTETRSSSPDTDLFGSVTGSSIPNAPCTGGPASHPEAGSVKAMRHPQYEKKTRAHSDVPGHVFGLNTRAPDSLALAPQVQFRAVRPKSASLTAERRTEDIWDQELTKASAIDQELERPAEATSSVKFTIIDLKGQQLTHIPRSITDLNNFVKLPRADDFKPALLSLPNKIGFYRTSTTPAPSSTSFVPSSRMLHHHSTNKLFGRRETHQIKLYLAQNNISRLPRELFTLQKLAVLSLRHNQITYLPPEIANLPNLIELHVANNQLRYLPAEMLRMSLGNLFVYPTSTFFKPEDCHASQFRSKNDPTRFWVSPTERKLDRTLSLAEMCLRVLLSPSCPPVPGFMNGEGTKQKEETTLQEYYGYPIPDAFARLLSQPLRDTLDIAAPGALGVPISVSGSVSHSPFLEDFTGVGICPSPRHSHVKRSEYRKPVFVKHAEERFTWEKVVADVDVGAPAPVRWRGCQWGCLDFLDEKKMVKGDGSGAWDTYDDVDDGSEGELGLRTVRFAAARSDDLLDF